MTPPIFQDIIIRIYQTAGNESFLARDISGIEKGDLKALRNANLIVPVARIRPKTKTGPVRLWKLTDHAITECRQKQEREAATC